MGYCVTLLSSLPVHGCCGSSKGLSVAPGVVALQISFPTPFPSCACSFLAHFQLLALFLVDVWEKL